MLEWERTFFRNWGSTNFVKVQIFDARDGQILNNMKI